MNNENSRQQDNQTATFKRTPSQHHQEPSLDLPPIRQHSDEDNPDNSMTMPQPLLDNPPPNDHQREFEPGPQVKQLNMTFYPQGTQGDAFSWSGQSLEQLRFQNSRLKLQMVSLNEMISEMVGRKNEAVSEYEAIINQKKVYKKLQKSLNEQYEGYLSMLRADYQFVLDQEIEKETKRHLQLKKEVQGLTNELSRPMVRDALEEEEKKEKMERELYQSQLYLEQMRVNNDNKQSKLAQTLQKTKDKEKAIKKLTQKITKVQEECQEEEFLSKTDEKDRKETYEKIQNKVARLRKIIEHTLRNQETEYQQKVRMCKEKEIILKNMERQIQDLSNKIQKQGELRKKSKKKQTLENVEVPSLPKSTASSKFPSFLREIESSTPKTQSDMVGNQFQGFRPLVSSKIYQSQTQSASAQHRHARTLTEGSEGSRLQLNLRKKKIYTQLEKNQYFKNIEHYQNEKVSRGVQNDQLSVVRGSGDGPVVKFPGISEVKERGISVPSESEGQAMKESIIEQAKAMMLPSGGGKDKRKSIEMHNYYMRQLRNDRKKLNIANYEELCQLLKRDKLLIEEDGDCEVADLIY